MTVRLLAGDDRPGLLDGAHLRALRGPPGLHLGGHRRGDDDRRGGRRDRPELPAARGARDRDPRGRPRGLLATSTTRTCCRPGSRSASAASSGGHHQAMEIEERFADWRSEMFGRLIHVLGAMAAEVVFYGQNTTGVGGDVRSVTWLAGRMVGFAAMAPERVDLSDRIEDPELREQEEDRIMERFERIGIQIMHRSGGGDDGRRPDAGRGQRPGASAGSSPACSARPTWSPTTRSAPTRQGTEHVADVLVAKREIYGDDVVDAARRGRARASPRSTCSTRSHGRRSDPAALARRAPGARLVREAASARASGAAASRSSRPRREPRAPRAAAPVAAGPSPYRPRFGFVLGALIGVALVAIGIGVALAASGGSTDGGPRGWSAWKPSAGDDAASGQADRRARRRRSTGSATRTSSSPSTPSRSSSTAARSTSRCARRAVGGDIELLDGNGVMYTLNGLGPNGSIPGGKPSEERHLLLRREALELALYTFRYRSDVDMVVALLPPAPPEKGEEEANATLPPVQALFYRPGDLSGELGVPLAATIPTATPRPAQIEARRARLAADRRADAARTCSRRRSSRARTRASTSCSTARRRALSVRARRALRELPAPEARSAATRGRSSRCACARGPTPRYPKYPRLPVLACRGHEPLRPGDDPAGPGPRGAGSPAA